MRKHVRMPSPALAVASIALLVALGGVSYAAVVLPANSVGTKQLKKNAVTGPKVKNGSLLKADFKRGQLPAGAQGPAGPQGLQGPPGPSTGPAGGDLQGSYPNPTIASGAVTSSKLSPLEAWNDVGAAGQPGFGFGWSYYLPASVVSFRKDRDGVVHLKGTAKKDADGAGSTMFTLPTGYRPAQDESFAVASLTNPGIVSISTFGTVFVLAGTNDTFVALSGITFTAA